MKCETLILCTYIFDSVDWNVTTVAFQAFTRGMSLAIVWTESSILNVRGCGWTKIFCHKKLRHQNLILYSHSFDFNPIFIFLSIFCSKFMKILYVAERCYWLFCDYVVNRLLMQNCFFFNQKNFETGFLSLLPTDSCSWSETQIQKKKNLLSSFA